ncbi:MAG: TylF/MycF/NovP-related O-methyltransferase [Phenylobacterium sp.]|nr:TylF/MycF/NovP-related O-methyltransferase [Phenylobacterium sp.]
MTAINFSNLTATQMIAMADGLAAAQQWGLARGLYEAALRGAPAALRRRLLVRRGLVTRPKSRTPAMLAALHALEGTVREVFVGEGLSTWLKTLPFLEDDRFIDLVEKHSSLLPLGNWHWNLQTALWAVQQALHVEGDLVELGVFRGHTTLFVAEYIDFAAIPRQWLLFDTFDGIPDDQLDAGWDKPNNVYKGTFSFEEVRDRFQHIPNVSVIKGRVPEVLEGRAPDKIAFIHMDMNNAGAEIAALDTLYDRLSPGGFILFDDFGWLVSRAQHDAERAWFAARGLQVLPLPTGQGLFVKPT